MSDKNYVVYHLHSDLSNGVTNIDSVTKYFEYIDYAKSLNMMAMGFSEHGSVLEWVHKKNKIEAAGMKYIHAEEFYITEELYKYPDIPDEVYESMLRMDEAEAQSEIEEHLENGKYQVRDNYHCVLIAKNYDGVEELNELSSKAFLRDGHFYYNPRITIDELINTSDNIIITTACLGGILASENKPMQEKMLKFCIKNKHRCYLEIQHHNDDKQKQYNIYLEKISKKYNIPLIAGTDTHCLNNKHYLGRQIMQKSKDVKFAGEDNWDLLFKTYDDLVDAYKKQGVLSESIYLEAIDNTNKMAAQIEPFKLDYSKKYPKLYDDSLGTLKSKIIDGIKRRGVNKYENYQEYKDRIQYELKTYIHNQAIDFILLEEDYKTALRNQGVEFGYSRGSVSGSEIAYLLGITEVDSIKFNLNFERFMNTERISLADVDTDWYKDDRWKVRQYLFQKEGLHCCNIITFNTIKLRGAIKDVGRALGMTPEQTQAISNMVQEDEKKKEFIPDKVREQYPELFEYVDIVVGTITSLGRHAAGLVVAPHEIDKKFGTLYISSDDKPISQINMKEIDSLNYVKLDVLGLDCVGLIYKTCKSVGIDFLTPDNMDFDDIEVWKDIANDTTLIFQFESDFAGNYLKDILRESTIKNIKSKNPNFSYIDLMSMANGAIRPAGESYRNELSQGIYRDNGHPALNEFLAPTLGYLVYQEQIIQFLHQFCGFTMGEADVVRRHFSKKTGTENDIPVIKNGGYLLDDKGEKTSDHHIPGFINTMKEKYNVEKEEAENLIVNFLQVIIDASAYLFSQNHADPYSFLGFACGYLRHYYPLETLTEALNVYAEDADKSYKIKDYIASKGINIKQIRFGYSNAEYTCDKETYEIYQGIGSIKYCNNQIAEELMELSKNKYKNFIELLRDIHDHTSVNSKQLEILIGLDFFSDFGKNKYLFELSNLYDKFATCKQIKKDKMESLGLTEYLMKKYAGKETAKIYKEIDNIGLITELSLRIENQSMSVVDQVKFEKEYLQYIVFKNPKVNKTFYIVTEYKTYKEARKPYLVLHNIKTGEDVKARVTSVKIYQDNPFGEYSILKIDRFTKKNKKKCVNGTWTETDELENILDDYEVIKK